MIYLRSSNCSVQAILASQGYRPSYMDQDTVKIPATFQPNSQILFLTLAPAVVVEPPSHIPDNALHSWLRDFVVSMLTSISLYLIRRIRDATLAMADAYITFHPTFLLCTQLLHVLSLQSNVSLAFCNHARHQIRRRSRPCRIDPGTASASEQEADLDLLL